jgi:hypothetical protein
MRFPVFLRQLNGQLAAIGKVPEVQDQRSIGSDNILLRSRTVFRRVKFIQWIVFGDLPVLRTPAGRTPSSNHNSIPETGIQSRPVHTGLPSRDDFFHYHGVILSRTHENIALIAPSSLPAGRLFITDLPGNSGMRAAKRANTIFDSPHNPVRHPIWLSACMSAKGAPRTNGG